MLDLALDRRLPGFHLRTQLVIGDGITALYGPSGSGKSLTLLAIAGLIRPASGTIRINGRSVFDANAGIDLAPHLRRVGLVFQEYALFPHKTVSGNLSFGLPRGTPAHEAACRVDEMLQLLRLQSFAQRYPHQLSGGQRQRVALGRALIGRPEILLLDEPFSALDPAVREMLRQELLQMLADYKGTILLVTHDLQEAYLMASTIAIIDGGKVLQMGTREEVLHQPRTRRVAEHTGAKNILRGVACRDQDGAWDIVWRGHHLRVDGPGPTTPGEVEFCIRPEDVRLVWPDRAERRDNLLRGQIVHELGRGLDYLLFVSLVDGSDRGKYDLEIQVRSRLYHLMTLHVGKEIWLSLPPDRLHLLAPDE
ncbi:ABC transporter ATP-binding protein [Candidatus Methylomirabilis sp.]|uniref:ABC transporter ATP-binding protein n=1 Tax=Candidatus Methylomirabilis tolerans TaxID=3123416 RepID=A0AAJ1EJT7_9BACT|nr:ABC transporter ATP-binding protein [Candidatus Methylomirabilis sp.]